MPGRAYRHAPDLGAIGEHGRGQRQLVAFVEIGAPLVPSLAVGDRGFDAAIDYSASRRDDVLTGQNRHVDGKSPCLWRQPLHRRRCRPFQTQRQISRHLYVGRKLLRTDAQFFAAVGARTRESQCPAQQSILGQARSIPAMSNEHHARRTQRKRQRHLVRCSGEFDLHAVHAATEREPRRALFVARERVGGNAVDLHAFQHRRLGIVRQRQCDTVADMRLERDDNVLARRADLRFGNAGASRRALRRFIQALAQLLQQLVRRIALRLRMRCRSQSAHADQDDADRRAARRARS